MVCSFCQSRVGGWVAGGQQGAIFMNNVASKFTAKWGMEGFWI